MQLEKKQNPVSLILLELSYIYLLLSTNNIYGSFCYNAVVCMEKFHVLIYAYAYGLLYMEVA